jgi:hypothetical protein
MHTCLKCNKEYKYESELIRHKNKKIPCDNLKKKLQCNLCNISFNRPGEMRRHDATKKHITNYNNCKIINANTATNCFNETVNNYINLTLNINSFIDTKYDSLRKSTIQDIIDNIYNENINKDISVIEKIKLMFEGLIIILEKIHFNLNMEDNHNCKILLMFPGLKKLVFEYLILEINPETKHITWRSIKYEEFINEIVGSLLRLNNIIKNDEFYNYIDYLDTYLVKKENNKLELKKFIEDKLNTLYNNFNKQQRKNTREVRDGANNNHIEIINEYKEYREEECKLKNGFSPDIIESLIN